MQVEDELIKAETSGSFREIILCLLLSIYDYEAVCVHIALNKCQITTLIEILATKDHYEMAKLKISYLKSRIK